MKKLFLYIFIFLTSFNSSFANEIKFSTNSLNKNITEYGWGIYRNEFMQLTSKQAVEIYTLEKQHKKNESVVLKCHISYYETRIITSCSMP